MIQLRAGVLMIYRVCWVLAVPGVLIYFWLRGRRDPAYRQHIGERFGKGPTLPGAVWVHAVSLGEMRSAVPLVRALLDQGESVLTTHLTPAGRRAAQTAFGPEIAAGRMVVRYLPLELGWAWRRFLRCRPKLALIMEIEVWPVMITEAKIAGVPLYLANSQYPAKSYARDLRFAHRLGHPLAGVAGVLAKSETHAARFRALGAPNVHVCGELRFDQPVPAALLEAAALLRAETPSLQARPVIALTSVVEGEDPMYIALYQAVQAASRSRNEPVPLFLHIPRAPERFALVGDMLEDAGQRILRRSVAFNADLTPYRPLDLAQIDVLLGDSLGEMYFYLALSDLVIVGGGFLPSGAHNVIEPLALRKPVLVGPQVWSIEYPGAEAKSAGVLTICPTIAALTEQVLALCRDPAARAALTQRTEAFFITHSGATARMMAIIAPLLAPRAPPR